MDAYTLSQQLLDAWRQVSTVVSGESAQKTYNETPVYVKIDTHFIKVSNVTIQNNQIIIETE